MHQDPFRPIPPEKFVELAQACGLDADEKLLDELHRRHLMSRFEESYTGLHLYTLALYFDAVRVHRHPWSPTSSDRSIDDVKKTSRKVESLLEAEDASSDEYGEFAMELERYINGIDPFGPLAGVVDFLRDDVRMQLRGIGRLYSELRLFASSLVDVSEEEPESPRTRPIPEADIQEEENGAADREPGTWETDARHTAEIRQEEVAAAPDQTTEPEHPTEKIKVDRERVRRTIESEDTKRTPPPEPEDTVRTRAPSIRPESSAGAGDNQDAPSEPEAPAQTGERPDEAADTRKISAVSDEEETAEHGQEDEEPAEPTHAAEPEETEEPPRESGFRGEQPRTSRSRDLMSRLEDLRTADFEQAFNKQEGTGERLSLEQRIETLNRLREQYIQDHDWAGLIDLYEDGIELFEDPAERQQVLLTLGTLYEVKQKNPKEAFRYFRRAIEEDSEAGSKKAMEAIRRLGVKESIRPDYLEWLENQIAGDLPESEQAPLQQDFARLLGKNGEVQRAFLTYAAFLAEKPDDRITAEALDLLDELAVQLADEELEGFFEDIIEQEPSLPVAKLVGIRAGLHYLGQGQPFRAIPFFRRVHEIDPGNEVAFTNLVRIYEDEGNWPEVVHLIEARLDRVAGVERARLRAELDRAVDEEIASDEEAFERYQKRLETDLDDEIALDRYLRAIWAHRNFAEGYAFLTRKASDFTDDAHRARVHKNLGDIAVRHLHAPEEAVVHFRQALTHGGHGPEILPSLIDVEIELDVWDSAARDVRALLELGAGLSRDERLEWLSRGVELARKGGDGELARTFREQIRDLDPTNEALSG